MNLLVQHGYTEIIFWLKPNSNGLFLGGWVVIENDDGYINR